MGSPTTSQSPYFGRAYKITVTTQSGEEVTVSNSTWDTEALRVVFTTEITANRAYSWADVVIFNMNSPTEQLVMKQGDLVTISAGYQATFNADKNQLGQWTLFQPMFDRENITDYKVTLHCILGLYEDAQNIVSFTQGPFATQAQLIRRMAQEAHTPITIEQIDEDTLTQKQLVRGKSVFGRPGDYFEQIAKDNVLSHFISPGGLNVRDISKPRGAFPGSTILGQQLPGGAAFNDQPDLVFGPPFPPDVTIHPSGTVDYTPTLIGTPQQTENGVSFRVLMDSRIKIGSVVRLSFSVIRQLPQSPGPSTPSFLDKDGDYVVYQIRNIGDTRGDPWYTDVLAMTKNFWPLYSLAPTS